MSRLDIDDGSRQRINDLLQGYRLAQIAGAAARLGVPDHLASGLTTAADVAAAAGADPAAMARFLRACAFAGLVRETEPDQFALTPLGECLRAGEGSLGETAAGLTAPAVWRIWERLVDAVTSGGPVARDALGMGFWEFLDRHPDEGAGFAAMMRRRTAALARDVAARFDPAGSQLIVDVAAGDGSLLAGLLERAPSASGICFDRPETAMDACAEFARRGLSARVALVGGHLLEAVPAGGDLYLLLSVLHLWPDEEAERILRNCHRAARPGSRLLVVELPLPAWPETSPHQLTDLSLLLTGGRERTLAEYRSLLAAAGFRIDQVRPAARGWQLLTCVRE